MSSTVCVRAKVVEQPAAGDREDPSPERGLVAVEPVQAARDIEPRLGGEILGIPWILGVEVAQDRWMEIPVKGRERPLAARPGGGEDAFELSTQPHERDPKPLWLGKCWVRRKLLPPGPTCGNQLPQA